MTPLGSTGKANPRESRLRGFEVVEAGCGESGSELTGSGSVPRLGRLREGASEVGGPVVLAVESARWRVRLLI